jgi:hypothetical protein
MKITKRQLRALIKEEMASMDVERTGGERPPHREHAVGLAEILAPKIMETVYNAFFIDDTVEGEEEMFQEAIKQLILDWYTSTGTFESLPGSKHPEYKYYDKPNFR